MSSMTFGTSGLKAIEDLFESDAIKREIDAIPHKTAVAAIVAQAIADNFNKEGPGWAPLKPETIRRSVSKKLRKKFALMTDEELISAEKKARKKGARPARMILQKTGTLKKSVTTPGAKDNIWKAEGTNLIWGTDLVYAGVHNRGLPSKNIPKREFLTIRDEWMERLNEYIAQDIVKVIQQNFARASA